jgi:DNA-binding MarR family transcriptional regulator
MEDSALGSRADSELSPRVDSPADPALGSRAGSRADSGVDSSADSPVDSVALADQIQRLTRRLRRSQAHALAPLGLTPAQERALSRIARSPEPLRMAQLADHLGIVPRSATTVVDALEEAGLVRREIDPANRRAILLHLTDQGKAVGDDMRAARRQAADQLFAPLAPGDRRVLLDILSRMNE